MKDQRRTLQMLQEPTGEYQVESPGGKGQLLAETGHSRHGGVATCKTVFAQRPHIRIDAHYMFEREL